MDLQLMWNLNGRLQLPNGGYVFWATFYISCSPEVFWTVLVSRFRKHYKLEFEIM